MSIRIIVNDSFKVPKWILLYSSFAYMQFLFTFVHDKALTYWWRGHFKSLFGLLYIFFVYSLHLIFIYIFFSFQSQRHSKLISFLSKFLSRRIICRKNTCLHVCKVCRKSCLFPACGASWRDSTFQLKSPLVVQIE